MAKTPAERLEALGERRQDLDARVLDVKRHVREDQPYRKQYATQISDKSVDADARTVEFVITTGNVDRDNDTIAPGGWDVKDFLRSPSVLWAHDYSHLPVGRALDITQTPDGLKSTVQFPPKGTYAFADTVFDLVRLGMLNACSVGFKPLEYAPDLEREGINFTRQSLLEWSIVPVPANAEALVVARSKGVNVEPLRQWALDILTSSAEGGDLALVHKLAGRTKANRKSRAARRSFKVLKQAGMSQECALALAMVDSFVDMADDSMDDVMAALGVPDADTGGGETVLPSSQVGNGSAGGDTSTGLPRGQQPSYDDSDQHGGSTRDDGVPPLGDGMCPEGYERRGGTCYSKAARAAVRRGMQECPKCHEMSYNGQSCSECDYQAPKQVRRVKNAALYALTRGGATQPVEPGTPVGEVGGPSGSVPPMGEAPASAQLCPACGSVYDGDVCPGCGWVAPPDDPGDSADPTPMTVPYRSLALAQGRAKAIRAMEHQPAFVAVDEKTGPWKTYRVEDDDPVRWNRQLSKAFDVAGEPLEPSRLEIAWVSRFIEAPVQQLSVETFFVPSARMGSFLAALDECLSAWQVSALRNMTEAGREVPPEYESIQLNSRTTRSFLVEGLRFMRRDGDSVKIVSKLSRTWSGLYVTQYARHDQAEVRSAWTNRVHQRAGELNYLRGEAFTLSGEFLDRGDLDWPALFLEPEKEKILRRVVERINEQGADMESRGLMEMGPPGTGKTLSGRVMMRQADTTFIWISARDFYRSGAFGAFTYAFDLAAECAPTILFFEDVDSYICGNDTIDLLKTEMDGIKRRKGVQTILTTNFPELIPDALIDRPGRFHDLLELALPTESVRLRMLSAWLPATTVEQRGAIAHETDGFSGAHLRELVNFARTIQAEDGLETGPALVRALQKLREQRALVESLRQAPDYRPHRHVRSLVGLSMQAVAKRGRVLSSSNEGKIRQAREHLDGVLEQLNRQPPPTETETTEEAAVGSRLVLTLAAEPVADDAMVLRLAPDPDPVIPAGSMKEAIRSAVEQTLGGLVREETQIALARARGRVD